MSQPEKAAVRLNASLLLAGLALSVAVTSGLLMMLAGVGSRLGWWHFRTGFTLLGYGAYGGVGAALLGFLGVILAGRKRQLAGILVATLAVVIGLVAAAVPASWRMTARKLPVIHDISTDTVHPPQFVAILPLRKDSPNPAVYGGPEVAEQQKVAYADLRTEVLDVTSGMAYDRALSTAKAMGWRIVAAEPAEGRIEATDTTFWFGFIDDIVIRIVPAGNRTMIDIRSVSRVGKSDVGTNARRIREYLKRMRAYK
jgi:uncharacterized protein DUF1499